MAGDQTRRPVSEDELDEAREAIREQREEIREFLAGEGVDVDEENER